MFRLSITIGLPYYIGRPTRTPYHSKIPPTKPLIIHVVTTEAYTVAQLSELAADEFDRRASTEGFCTIKDLSTTFPFPRCNLAMDRAITKSFVSLSFICHRSSNPMTRASPREHLIQKSLQRVISRLFTQQEGRRACGIIVNTV